MDENELRIETSLTTLLGIEHPILLAPMGDSAGGRLAAAVSTAGGLGMIGGGYGDPEWLARELAATEGARVGVGFITFALDGRRPALDIALEARPVAVQLSFGDPRPYAEEIHAADALLICQVQTPEEIRLARAAGADVLIAQGQDAGGHGRPDRGTIGLVPSLVDEVDPLPVVAAGGIADGRGLAAAITLGAAGVSMGTRLLASAEAISSSTEADALVAGHAHETVRTSAFDVIRGPAWPDGLDGRAIRNPLVDTWNGRAEDPDGRRRYVESGAGDGPLAPVWAGEGLDLVRSIDPAGSIVGQVAREAGQRLLRSAGRVVPTPR